VVDGWAGDGAQDPWRDVGRAWDLQEVVAGLGHVGFSFCGSNDMGATDIVYMILAEVAMRVKKWVQWVGECGEKNEMVQ